MIPLDFQPSDCYNKNANPDDHEDSDCHEDSVNVRIKRLSSRIRIVEITIQLAAGTYYWTKENTSKDMEKLKNETR